MATSRSPSRVLGSTCDFTPSPSPRRTQYTFSTQRAEFTKPVPAALLPVYPTFANSSDSDDDASEVNMLTVPIATPQGQRNGASAAEEHSQRCLQDLDTMATVGQTANVRVFAEKSGISPTSNLPLNTADLDRSPPNIDGLKEHPTSYSNFVMARLASFLGLQKRQERRSDRPASTVTAVPLPALTSTREPKHSPFPSPLRPDSLRPGSSLSANNSLCAEDHRNTNMPSPPDPFLRHHRSRSLDISRHPATSLHAASFAPEVSLSDSRSRSMDGLSRCVQSTFGDENLRLSSCHAPPVSIPPNCVLVQVGAVGLDESDRQLAMGFIIDEAHKFKTTQEAIHQGRKKDRREEEKEKESGRGWLNISNVKLLSESEQQTPQKYHGNGMAREVSLPKAPQLLEAEYIPGRSFVGRVLEVGSVVEKTFAARDDWVVGLVDIRKCGPLAELIVVDWRQVHRVPAPLGHATSTSPTLVSSSPSSIPTEEVLCNRDTEGPLPHFIPLTFDELALLPLCGIPAYRAVQTCIDAFPVGDDDFDACCVDGPTSECPHATHGQRRRVLVLRGHDGVGAMAVQMLIQQGWQVSVHVPFSRVPWDASQAEADGFMSAIEDRLKMWGVDEVIYDDGISYDNWDGQMDDRKAAVVRVIETLLGEDDVFDAVLDLVGGKEIQEAGERLLRLNGCPASHRVGQFTTLLGPNAVDDPISTLNVNSRSNLANPSTFTLHDPRSHGDEDIENFRDIQSGDIGRRVKHTLMEDVFDSEDEEVWEILDSVLRLALEDGIRPHVEEAGGEIFGRRRVVSLEEASDIAVDGDLLSDGGMIVVRVVR